MNDKSSFLEFPPLDLPNFKSQTRGAFERPSPQNIFLSQATDHAIAFLCATVFLGAGLSLFRGVMGENILQAAPLFWMSALATLSATSLLYRLFFHIFVGWTPGNYLFHIEARATGSRFWAGQIFESLHLAIPALWLTDILSRHLDFNVGIDYSFKHYAYAP